MDQYQERYLAHQQKKKVQLIEIIKTRHSDRIFSDKEIELDSIHKIMDSLEYIPSSCNRKGVYTRLIEFRDNKELLGGLLVGGVGWVHRANKIFLIIADGLAYKEGVGYMPYLDAGFVASNIWMTCTELGIQACFVNPNVREANKDFFRETFLRPSDIFCGAMALGYKEGVK